MTTALLAPALLCAALALTLGFTTSRTAIIAIALTLTTAVLLSASSLPQEWRNLGTLACWIAVPVTIATMHWPRRVPNALALMLAAAVGICVGIATPRMSDLALSLPLLLLAAPAVLVARRAGIVLKVAGSWLAAVAILAAVLPLVAPPVTASDHRD
jgi:hypothetical protein